MSERPLLGGKLFRVVDARPDTCAGTLLAAGFKHAGGVREGLMMYR